MKMDKKLMIECLAAAGLVGAAVVWRLVNNEAMVLPNLELVTAASLVAAVFMRRPVALAVPVAAMVVSDAIIGGSMPLFTWSAFLVIAVSGLWLRRFVQAPQKLVLATGGTGLAAALFFFAWTNFGVWFMADGSFYPKTWEGLMLCYTYGLPFLRGSLVSGVIVAPVVMAAAVYAPKWLGATQRRLAAA